MDYMIVHSKIKIKIEIEILNTDTLKLLASKKGDPYHMCRVAVAVDSAGTFNRMPTHSRDSSDSAVSRSKIKTPLLH